MNESVRFIFMLLSLPLSFSSNITDYLTSTNKTNSSSGTQSSNSSKDINGISYGIFVFLFAIFVIFLLLGFFCFCERFFWKNKKKILSCLKYLIQSSKYFANRRQVRPLSSRRRKKKSNNRESIVYLLFYFVIQYFLIISRGFLSANRVLMKYREGKCFSLKYLMFSWIRS